MCSVAQYLISVYMYLMLNTIRLQQKTQKNIHHSKPYKVQTMKITKLFTVFVYFGRHM